MSKSKPHVITQRLWNAQAELEFRGEQGDDEARKIAARLLAYLQAEIQIDADREPHALHGGTSQFHTLCPECQQQRRTYTLYFNDPDTGLVCGVEYDTEKAALTEARRLNLEAFEIRDSTDLQVYVEWPKPVWS